MRYLAHLRKLQAQADRPPAADFTQFTQVPTSDYLDKNLKLRPEGIGQSGVATMQVREQGSEVLPQIANSEGIPTTKQVEYSTADGSFTHFTQDPVGALPSKTLHPSPDKGSGDEHNLKGCFTQSGLKQLERTALDALPIHGKKFQSSGALAPQHSNHAVCGTSKFPNSRDVLDSSNDLRFISQLCGDRLELDPINLEKNTPDRTCINCVKSDQTKNHTNTNSGNANVIPSCSQCRYASRYGNCTEPIAAGLSSKFMLISHKQGPQEVAMWQGFEPSWRKSYQRSSKA
ncbi:MAG: hypothetical protein EBW14_14685 [Oxalobacteraceae bacterium]|nr:hypothetical protein [Oxalobacteraceae bacterium]